MVTNDPVETGPENGSPETQLGFSKNQMVFLLQWDHSVGNQRAGKAIVPVFQ